MTGMHAENADLPRRRPDLRVRRLGAHVVLVDPANEEVCQLNETAFALWQLCDGETSPAEMSTAICTAAGLDNAVAEREVGSALDELRKSGALT